MDSPAVAIFVLLGLAAYLTYRLLEIQKGRAIYEAKCQQEILQAQVKWGELAEAHELRVTAKIEEMRTTILQMQQERARKDRDAEQWREVIEAALKMRGRY